MTGNRVRFLFVSMIAAAILVTGSLLTSEARGDAAPTDSLYKYLSVFTDVYRLVHEAYVEEPEVDDLFEGAYRGMLDALGPFATYVSVNEVERYRRVAETEGVPASGLFTVREGGFLYVAGVVEGSPAAEAELRRGDLISRVDGEPTHGIDPWRLEETLVNADGPVVLETLRLGERRTVSLELEPYEPVVVDVREAEGVRILDIGWFGPETVERMREELERAAEEDRTELVLDLRQTAGGDPEVAYRVAGLFTGGELGTLERKGGVEQRFTSDREPVWRGELVTLVDRGTLGAAEVLAIVLAQRADAEMVGERTSGHAGRLAVTELSTGGLLRVTDAYYTGPDGDSIDEPLRPDIEVEPATLTLEERDRSTQELILERGLEVLRGEDESVREAA